MRTTAIHLHSFITVSGLQKFKLNNSSLFPHILVFRPRTRLRLKWPKVQRRPDLSTSLDRPWENTSHSLCKSKNDFLHYLPMRSRTSGPGSSWIIRNLHLYLLTNRTKFFKIWWLDSLTTAWWKLDESLTKAWWKLNSILTTAWLSKLLWT